MVDLALLQSVSYIVGALGVGVAAAYYVMNLRNAKNDRQASLFMGIYRDMTTSDMPRMVTGLMSYTWTDFADFQRKYDSRVNPESYTEREMLWNWFNNLGILVKRKLIDRDLVYDIIGPGTLNQWSKWGGVINEYKKIGDISPDHYTGFEYLAGEMANVKKARGTIHDVNLSLRAYEKPSP